MGVTLIFPCCVPAAAQYAEAATQRGEKIVASSSLAFDETAKNFETWFRLPSVNDMDFAERLAEAVGKFDIERIYSPVLMAWVVLNRLAEEKRLSVPVIGEMPIKRYTREHRQLMAAAAARHEFIASISSGRSRLTLPEVAAILKLSGGIYGESNETKIAAVMAIFADAPRGDIVEIGVLTGRSAAVLLMMSRHHAIGNLLVVDPWSPSEAIQHDSPLDIQGIVDAWQPGVAFESFLVALLPFAGNQDLNYLAQPSNRAHAVWLGERKVVSPEFGEVRYSSSIAVLHIDGNHDYASVSEDCALWLPHLVPGGWLILDDYVWLHGDGPQRVGNELLEKRANEIQRAFTCGKALFVKFGA